MSDAHPWLSWLIVLLIFGGGLCVVMILVKLLILWAQRDESKNDDRIQK